MKKIAFIGIRGIPVVYSGFESFVEDLTNNLKGFSFYVYCRRRYLKNSDHHHVHLIFTPTLYIYKLETFIHSFISSVHVILFTHVDYVFYLGVGNAPFLLIPRLFGIKTIINVDGMDWEREKWGYLAKWYLYFCAYISTKLANVVVTDSMYSYEYYEKHFHKKTFYIPYMSNGHKWKENKNVLKKYNLIKNGYFVWAGRLVPDNHLEDLLSSFMLSTTKKKLVVMGGDYYKTTYLEKISHQMKKDARIIYTGFLPRDIYLTLIANSYTYVETKQSGGTHPTLIDGLTYASRVICNDFPANRTIGEDIAHFYQNRNIDSLKKELDSQKIEVKTTKTRKNMCFDSKLICDSYRILFKK